MESPQNNMNGHSTMHYKRIVKYEHYSETSSKSILTSEDAFTRLSAESNGEEGKKSFIQQRIERLYGPAALGMAFQAKRALLERMKEKEEVVEKEIPITKEPPQGLPSVFRHLRPEFRYQLPVKSKRNDLFQNNLVRFDDIHDRNANNSSVAPPQKLSDVKVKSVNGNVNNDSKSWRTLSKELESISKGVETSTKPVESKETITQNGSRSPDKRIPEVEDVPKLEKAKDGNYFLEVVGAEIARLEPEIARIEEDLKLSDDAMSEEVRGKLMAISGKARLLLSQKVEQFRGLCYQNINKKETDEFVTTNEDLAGFWDMVNIQVDAVKDMLKEVDELRRNDWKEKTEPLVPQGGKGGTSTIARSGTNPSQRRTQTASKDPKATEKSLAAKKVREEQRRKMREALAAKRLEASKAAASSSSQSAEQGVEIFVSKKP